MAVAFVKGIAASSGSGTTTLSATLASAPAAGSLLILAMGGDKDTGTLTLSGFNELYTIRSTSTTLYYWYKVSAGNETTINPSWSLSSSVGNMAYYAEYDDPLVSGSTWQISAQQSNPSDEVAGFSWSTGTTGTISAAGLGVAAMSVDSSQNVTSVTSWSNGYTARYTGTGGAGRGAIFTAEKSEAAGGTTSTTFTFSGTTDQVNGAIAVWTKMSEGGGGLPVYDAGTTGMFDVTLHPLGWF